MNLFRLAALLCAIAMTSSILIVGCSEDTDLFETADLDVNQTVPLATRSNPQDIYTGNQPQKESYLNVPKEEGECMLNAIIQIAVDKNKKVFGHSISERYPASYAYEVVKECAMDYVKMDSNGNPDPTYVPYTGGAMTPSLAAEVGRKSGILSGQVLYFESYTAMQEHLNAYAWKSAHPAGTYIINSDGEQHASICTEIRENGDIRIKSAQYGTSTMNPKNENYKGFSIIF